MAATENIRQEKIPETGGETDGESNHRYGKL
jgi:hypothetical protein